MTELVAANRVFLEGGAASWAELLARATSRHLLATVRRRGGPVAIIVASDDQAFEAVAVMARYEVPALLLGRDRCSRKTLDLLASLGYSIVEYPGTGGVEKVVPGSSEGGTIGLLTSGSTGEPKLVEHTWRTLYTGARCRSVAPRRWLMPYQIGTYAWYQLVTLGLFQPGNELVPLSAPSAAGFIDTVREHNVTCVSSTPTLWRFVLLEALEAEIKELPLQQITLGGEIVDQALLDRLHTLFPDARFTHIYASSEAGACIVVNDGRSGFPVQMLEPTETAGESVRIEQGRLLIRSKYSARAAAGAPSDWVDTGDRVAVRGDRVVFLGRADSRAIGIGGAKVFPAEIEAALLEHPGVSWCRVRGVRAPLVGQLPTVEYVLAPDRGDPSEADLMVHCRARLFEAAVPRLWRRLETIPMQPSLKAPVGAENG